MSAECMDNPEVPESCKRSLAAFRAWSAKTAAERAGVLRALAGALEAERAAIIHVTVKETSLTAEELAPEFARMVGTLRMFADVIERGTWHVPAIDTAVAAGGTSIGPGHDVRRTMVPLGPVAVFGASNFPLAYGVCGGDTASALAAGCSVVVKEHPAHPRTGRLLWSVAANALERAAAIPGLLGYVANEDPEDFSVAQSLVQDESIAGVGFTGSIKGGLAIDRLARERAVPIPAYCEMGSVNPVFITTLAAKRRGAEVGALIADSVLMRYGQQCTRPGVVVVDTSGDTLATTGWGKGADGFDALEEVVGVMRTRIGSAPERDMLSPHVRNQFRRRVHELLSVWQGAPEEPRVTGVVDEHFTTPVLFEIDEVDIRMGGRTFAEEVFGPCCVVTGLNFSFDGKVRDFLDVFGGQLTVSVFHEGADDPGLAAVLMQAQQRAGRFIFNGVPTGVRVAHGMVHTGPFPSSNRPEATAVGPLAIQRWCRAVCYQNCPQALLPNELKDGNPLGIMRLVNGEFTVR